MSGTTSIEWTDATWNPLRGCSRVSEGCRNCYAERMAFRFSGEGQPYSGLVRIDAKGERQPAWNGRTQLVESHLLDPLRWQRPRRIFVNSMSDLFHESVPLLWLDRIFAVMAWARQHTFQVLTKRPARMKRYSLDTGGSRWPLANVMLGVSVEHQEAADERIPLLLETPAAWRFLSVEPLLGPVMLDGLAALDWVIVGGESGAGARPCDLAWIRDVVAQCASAGVPCFVKQIGTNAVDTRADQAYGVLPQTIPRLSAAGDRKGGAMERWPEALRVRKLPRGVGLLPSAVDLAG